MPVWQSVMVAFSERRVSSSPSGRPTVRPRPTTTTSAPAISTSCRRSSSMIPIGVHGSEPRSPSTSLPRLTGCSPSTSLSGSTRDSRANSSRPVGCCTRKPVQAGSAFSASMTRSTSAWVAVAGRSTRIDSIPISAQSLCLAPTYHRRARVVADQHGAEAGHDAELAQLGDPLGELRLDRLERGLAVECLCGHGFILSSCAGCRGCGVRLSPGFDTLRRDLVPRSRSLLNLRTRATAAPWLSGQSAGCR